MKILGVLSSDDRLEQLLFSEGRNPFPAASSFSFSSLVRITLTLENGLEVPLHFTSYSMDFSSHSECEDLHPGLP
ncbi:hypothetical protein DY000_02029088 [Brassica cretica]|uniref:Uncharacterized protein n=1 Tax=Brassica cretica TaxID=69181 RepID=A0ABQ7DG33_BRACR|nr:hypothetical protein DY000_02029088 [Brassica cretica]